MELKRERALLEESLDASEEGTKSPVILSPFAGTKRAAGVAVVDSNKGRGATKLSDGEY
jgi:hypothetical protein